MKEFLLGLFARLSLLLMLTTCSDNKKEFDDCVARGVQFYKEHGSYPIVAIAPNTGRFAVEVAEERCNRTTKSF